MKKLLCVFILLLSIAAFALQKSGIKEYDDLDLSKGEIVLYLDKDCTAINDPSAAQYYRKNFGKKGNLYLFVDFYSYTDNPEAFFKSYDLDGTNKREGKYISYNLDGSLNYIADIKNNELNGKTINYENEMISSIVNYKKNLTDGNTEDYFNGKIYSIVEYKDELPDGKSFIYNTDGSIAITQIYKNGEFIDRQKVNYKLQKTGILEYDNIDFSKGEIVAFYDKNGELVHEDSSEITIYRKSFGKTKDNDYLLVNYFFTLDLVQSISKSKNIYDYDSYRENKIDSFSFYGNGNIESITKNSEINKSHKILEYYDPFGKINVIITVGKNGNLINSEFFK